MQLRLLIVTAALAGLCAQAHAALSVSSGTTSNVTCTSHVCTSTAASAVLNVHDLKNLLSTGDTTVIAAGGANDLAVASPLTWSDTRRLTLDAPHSIRIDRNIEVTGPGQVWLTINDGGSGGNLSFGARGTIHFWDLSSGLTINGVPYTLEGDVAALASDVAAHPSGHFALAADYDATPDGTYASSPIPTHFTGAFEGLNHVISHLRVVQSTTGNLGLFAETEAGSSIENLGLASIVVRGTTRVTAGGLAGQGAGRFENVFAKGTVAGRRNSNVGGLVGELVNGGQILSSYTSGKITVTIGGSLGGLAGGTDSTVFVQNAHSTASVTGGGGSFAGGLFGVLSGTVKTSWASGAVAIGDQIQGSPPASAGGLVGYLLTSNSLGIIDCYATGAVASGNGTGAGGLVGATSISGGFTPIKTSYSTGAVTAGAGGSPGGFIGFQLGSGGSANAYWDTTTSGISNPAQGVGNVSNAPGITGLTNAQLQSGLPAGFNGTVWALDSAINGGLPFLIANPPG